MYWVICTCIYCASTPSLQYCVSAPSLQYCASAPSLHTDCREFTCVCTCTLCYVTVNWILHFKCITDFDALQWALIACTNIWCIYELHMCPALGKTTHQTLYRFEYIYMSVDYLGLLHMHVHVHYGLVPRLLPQLFILYKKKQCWEWEGVYERGVAWPSHLRTLACAVSAKHCSCKMISGVNPWASSDYIKLHIRRTHFNVLCSLTDWQEWEHSCWDYSGRGYHPPHWVWLLPLLPCWGPGELVATWSVIA